jgi:hypothetical protein
MTGAKARSEEATNIIIEPQEKAIDELVIL